MRNKKMIHDLKINPNCLDNLVKGIRKVEIRLNDRDYQKGDSLRFNEYKLGNIIEHLFEITHIHSGLGMEKNYIALSLIKIDIP